MNRLTDMIPLSLIRTAVAALSLVVVVATVTATLMSPSGAEAAVAPRQALAPERCGALEAKASKAKTKETRAKKKKARARKTAELRGTLNINNATAEQLAMLPGVGPAKAERVVAYRKAHGNFRRVKDLRRVKGFGYKSLKKLDKWLTIKGSTTLEVAKADPKK